MVADTLQVGGKQELENTEEPFGENNPVFLLHTMHDKGIEYLSINESVWSW